MSLWIYTVVADAWLGGLVVHQDLLYLPYFFGSVLVLPSPIASVVSHLVE